MIEAGKEMNCSIQQCAGMCCPGMCLELKRDGQQPDGQYGFVDIAHHSILAVQLTPIWVIFSTREWIVSEHFLLP